MRSAYEQSTGDLGKEQEKAEGGTTVSVYSVGSSEEGHGGGGYYGRLGLVEEEEGEEGEEGRGLLEREKTGEGRLVDTSLDRLAEKGF